MTPLDLLADLCSVPTAPFAEANVIEWVAAFAKDRKLDLQTDKWGNLLLSLGPIPKPGKKRLVLAAHMDHPGFVSAAMTGPKELTAHFRGGVAAEYIVPGTKVRFFPRDGEIVAKVLSVAGQTKDRPYLTSAKLSVPTAIPAGVPGMFDFTPAKFTQTHFHSRVCDDLAGAAAALSALDALRKDKPKIPFAVLLTRAEEVGFVGAIGAVLSPQLLRKDDDLLLAIECSMEQPYAQQQHGVIIRVGDRTSIFNSSLTAFLTTTAENLAKKNKLFKYQRALMPGGTCESTVYDAWGYHSAAVCVPLGNYHNMDRAKKKLAPENVATSDYLNEVALFIELAHNAHDYAPGHLPLKKRLTERFEEQKHLLA
jgi:endoglucanase